MRISDEIYSYIDKEPAIYVFPFHVLVIMEVPEYSKMRLRETIRVDTIYASYKHRVYTDNGSVFIVIDSPANESELIELLTKLSQISKLIIKRVKYEFKLPEFILHDFVRAYLPKEKLINLLKKVLPEVFSPKCSEVVPELITLDHSVYSNCFINFDGKVFYFDNDNSRVKDYFFHNTIAIKEVGRFVRFFENYLLTFYLIKHFNLYVEEIKESGALKEISLFDKFKLFIGKLFT